MFLYLARERAGPRQNAGQRPRTVCVYVRFLNAAPPPPQRVVVVVVRSVWREREGFKREGGSVIE